MKGAEATAVAIVMARQGKSKEEIRSAMEEYYDLSVSVDEYRRRWNGHGWPCQYRRHYRGWRVPRQ